MFDIANFKPGMRLTYFIPPGAYGYSRTNRIDVKAHCISDTGKRIKCEFVTANGREVHRWLSPASLSEAKWTSWT
jgi:hypothetical protein